MTELRRTPLAALHERLGGRMVPFAGFSMPVQYTSIVEEHRAARETAALFDVSHMGQVALSGAAAGAHADRLCTRAMSTLAPGRVRYALLCALVAVVFIYLRVADENGARADAAERDRARFVQRMEEARLKMLQAQIEPHFLFNSLANVRSLHTTAPADAERMLDNLMKYFAAALPHMRAAESTLGREASLTTSYLEIQAIRMGRRLAFDVDIPAVLAGVPFPPLMLLTLVENAIRHGLAPQPGGGAVRVDASLHDRELRVRVSDSGRGFTQTSGRGTGLANVRARLAAIYGESGRLSLKRNLPQGVVATIALPLAVPLR